MTDISVPRPNPNDEQFILVEWLVEDGTAVERDDLVASIETSKVSQDIHSPASGYLRHRRQTGQWCTFDEPIGVVVETLDEQTTSEPEGAAVTTGAPVLSADARQLAAELGVTDEQVASLGKRIVGSADIRSLAASSGSDGAEQRKEPFDHLPSGQRTVAAVVAESHTTIPAAFVALKVDVEDVLRWTEEGNGQFLGLTELIVKAVGMQETHFPVCFREDDGDAVRFGGRSNVAVTFDVGSGLKLPVVRDAAAKQLRDISAELLRLRMKAVRGTLTGSDFDAPSIMISLNFDSSVLFAIPMIFPGLTCAVSVGDPLPELVRIDDGETQWRRQINLGLAYDHRYLNGRDAIAFLNAVSAALTGLARQEPQTPVDTHKGAAS